MRAVILSLVLVISGLADDRLGVATHFNQGWDVPSVMPLISGMGAGWIRDEEYWANFEASKGVYALEARTQNWLNAAETAGLKVVLCFNYGNPLYADSYDPVGYAAAAGALARIVKSFPAVGAIEILNEPNNDFAHHYGGTANVVDSSAWQQKYVMLLNGAYAAIKAQNPSLTVIGIGAQATDNDYILSLGARCDGTTAHPYPPPAIIPESVYEPPFTSFNAFMNDAHNHDLRPIWHTEWGASTSSAGNYEIDEYNQALFCARKLLLSLSYPRIVHTFIYDFKDNGFGTDPNAQAGVGITQNLNPKQAYHVVARIMNAIAGLPWYGGVYVNPQRSDLGFDFKDFCASAFYGSGKSVATFWEGNGYPNYSTSSKSGWLSWGHPNAQQVSRVSAYDPFTNVLTVLPRSAWTIWGDSQIAVFSWPVTNSPQLLIAQ